MLHKYKCTFYVNGVRTEQVVSAVSQIDARKIIEAQYSNCRISQFISKRID